MISPVECRALVPLAFSMDDVREYVNLAIILAVVIGGIISQFKRPRKPAPAPEPARADAEDESDARVLRTTDDEFGAAVKPPQTFQPQTPPTTVLREPHRFEPVTQPAPLPPVRRVPRPDRTPADATLRRPPQLERPGASHTREGRPAPPVKPASPVPARPARLSETRHSAADRSRHSRTRSADVVRRLLGRRGGLRVGVVLHEVLGRPLALRDEE